MKALKENWQFRRLYRTKSQASSVLITYYQKNKVGHNRVGITTSKKIGKAHDRNRARRVIKEAFHLLEPSLNSGYDFVFVARTRTTTVKMDRVKYEMEKHLSKLMKEQDVKTVIKKSDKPISQGH